MTFGCWTSVAASRCCRSSKNSTACSSIRCSTKARSARRTSSTPAPPQPAADPRRRVPDEQGGRRGQELLPARHRLRVSRARPTRSCASSCSPRASPTRHHGGVHAVRPQDYQTIVGDDEEVLLGRQAHGGDLDHQRRLERSLLQGVRQPGHEASDMPDHGFLRR